MNIWEMLGIVFIIVITVLSCAAFVKGYIEIYPYFQRFVAKRRYKAIINLIKSDSIDSNQLYKLMNKYGFKKPIWPNCHIYGCFSKNSSYCIVDGEDRCVLDYRLYQLFETSVMFKHNEANDTDVEKARKKVKETLLELGV